jgi:fibronectin type 3 domain-containing protein
MDTFAKQSLIALIVLFGTSLFEAGVFAQNVAHGVTLTWSWTGNGTPTFNVYRSTASGKEIQPALVTGVTTPTFNDGTAAINTTYYYTVTSVVGGIESAPSTEVSAQIVPPGAPTNPATAVH